MPYSPLPYSPLAIVCGVVLLLCYNPASAQQQGAAVSAFAEAKACMLNAYGSREAAPLVAHLPLQNPNAPTLEQLSDSRYTTKAEVAALTAVHPLLAACRSALMARLNASAAWSAPIFQRLFAAGDDDRVLLIQRRLTWGDFVRRSRDRSLAASAELQQQANVAVARQQQTEADQAQQRRAVELLEAQRRAVAQQQLQQNIDRMNTYWVPQFQQQSEQRTLNCRVNGSPSLFGPTLNCN